jgi:hypothetical protein
VEQKGMNKAAPSWGADVDTLGNPHTCKVGRFDTVMGEMDDQTYLCWTISPQHSCVMEYIVGTMTEKEIFRMAESVSLT